LAGGSLVCLERAEEAVSAYQMALTYDEGSRRSYHFVVETPRRLTPAFNVARDLYLRSGNRCAYPGCAQPLMTSDGVLVGEIAHIEAAMPDGPRFREEMSNEDRRAFTNLLLVCGTHHTIIDGDTATWTVERLKELKTAHEAVYTGAVDRLRSTVGDVTEGVSWESALNLGRMLGLGSLGPDELAMSLATVNELAQRLASVPVGPRSVLALIVTHGDAIPRWLFRSGEMEIPIPVLEQVASCTRYELRDHLTVLEHAGLVVIDAPDHEIPKVIVRMSTGDIGWPVLAELKGITGADRAAIRRVLVDLDFTVFDS
jgi:hypothetical protein